MGKTRSAGAAPVSSSVVVQGMPGMLARYMSGRVVNAVVSRWVSGVGGERLVWEDESGVMAMGAQFMYISRLPMRLYHVHASV